jgi:hypothetical protein
VIIIFYLIEVVLDAPLGVGNTNIRFADQRTGKNNPKYIPYKNYIIKSVLDDKQEGGLK